MTASRWTLDDLPDLTGQTWLITGATNGLGLEAGRAATGRGARVILAVRDRVRGEQVAGELGNAEVLELDLADLASVRRAAANVSEIDVLVNNAGASPNQRTETVDGFESHLGVNVLGPFLFTNLILDRVRRRVVILASMTHRSGKFDFDDPHFRARAWTKAAAYSQSKLADLLWGAELSRRVGADGRDIDVQIAHPGWAATNMGNPVENEILGAILNPFVPLLAQPANRAALPTLYAATQDLPPGSYVGPDGFGELRGYPKLVSRSKTAADPQLAARFWDFATQETQKAGACV